MVFAGDLLNQCISSTFGLRGMNIPFLGQYRACSTMAQTLIMASIMVECGAANYTCAVTSSHFCTAERQFRTPLEYGSQRAPTAQWTATASGSAVLGMSGDIQVRHATVGRITDLGVTDMTNMGAAMAPAAAQAAGFFNDTATKPEDYDRIYTGDLGAVGTKLLYELLRENGIVLRNHEDCGLILFDREAQDVHAGGSGCRMLSRCIMRAYFEPHGSRRAEKYSLYGDRRADVHNLFAAGREHTGHRAFGACGEGITAI